MRLSRSLTIFFSIIVFYLQINGYLTVPIIQKLQTLCTREIVILSRDKFKHVYCALKNEYVHMYMGAHKLI